jgi:hypothetical protein
MSQGLSLSSYIEILNWPVWKPKGKAFWEVFFPEPPEAELSDISYAWYHELIDFPEIMEHEVRQEILDAPKGKATGEDAILNSIPHTLEPVVVPYLTSLFNTCVWLGYNLSHF